MYDCSDNPAESVFAYLHLNCVHAAIVPTLQCVEIPASFVFIHAYRCVQQCKATYSLPNAIVAYHLVQ